MKKLLLSILVCQSAGIIGSFFTVSGLQWYATLSKPSFSPPNWVFGPVWITLYFLMGIALFLVWRRGLDKKEVRLAFWFFIAHLSFNALWSVAFFGLRDVTIALSVILFLLAMIIRAVKQFWPIDKRAGYLLLPYLVWVSFATVLNYYLWALN